jgi:hypothetical protein
MIERLPARTQWKERRQPREKRSAKGLLQRNWKPQRHYGLQWKWLAYREEACTSAFHSGLCTSQRKFAAACHRALRLFWPPLPTWSGRQLRISLGYVRSSPPRATCGRHCPIPRNGSGAAQSHNCNVAAGTGRGRCRRCRTAAQIEANCNRKSCERGRRTHTMLQTVGGFLVVSLTEFPLRVHPPCDETEKETSAGRSSLDCTRFPRQDDVKVQPAEGERKEGEGATSKDGHGALT